MPKGLKTTHQDFLNRLANEYLNFNDIEILDEYVSYVSKIRCKCKLCGKIWTTTPKQLLQDKQKCPNCLKQNKSITHEEYVERVKTNNPHFDKFIFLTKYFNMTTPIKLQCKNCGHIWETRPYDLTGKGVDCPSCSGNATATHDMFLERFRQKNKNYSDIELLSKYEGATHRIDCRCKICNHHWSPLASSLLQGSGCPECAKKRIAKANIVYLEKSRSTNPAVIPMTNEKFISKLKSKNHNYSNLELLTPYTGSKQRVKCKCKKCGCEWETLPSSLLSGSGCPECAHTSTSFMEQFIYKALIQSFGQTETINRDKKLIGRELDVLIPSYKFAVEIGSWKWHKDIVDNDLEKQELCAKKGYRLFIIYDVCRTSSDKIKKKDIWTYPFDLSDEKDFKSLKNIIEKILKLYNIPIGIDDFCWNEIVAYAYEHSQRVDFKEFKRRFKESNNNYDDIEIIGPYTKLSAKIKCRCKKCGHIFEPVAFDLLRRNTGCVICRNKEIRANKRKINLIAQWRKNNPNGNKKQCHKETGVSYVTVLKWWDAK